MLVDYQGCVFRNVSSHFFSSFFQNETSESSEIKVFTFGHVVFYNEKEKFVINGDVLFRGSFGRYDLPGGNLETLKKSIKEVMFNLPEDTIVYSGHGPATSIGNEKYSNPILNY